MTSAHIITGQTATGKTSRALSLAKQVNGYIISADSRQIYSEMDIITGKDIKPEDTWVSVESSTSDDNKNINLGYYLHSGVMMWGLDCISPDTHFSVYQYSQLVERILSHTIVKDMVPIVVGGTYLYIKALLYGLDATVGPEWDKRSSYVDTPLTDLQKKLKEIAPDVFAALNNSERHNPHRLIRKIEIACSNTQKLSTEPVIRPLSYFGFEHQSTDHAITAITKRVNARIKAGAQNEVKKLLAKGYTAESPGMRTPGYQEILQHIQGNLTWDQAVEKWIRSEVQYAKRQKTFMKKDSAISWEAVS